MPRSRRPAQHADVNGANGRPATTPPLHIDRASVDALQPLERASMLPPSSFTDAAVFERELDLFCGG